MLANSHDQLKWISICSNYANSGSYIHFLVVDMILSTPIIYLVESTNLPVSPTLGGGQKPTPSPTTTQLAVTSTSSNEGVGLPRSTVITSQSIGKQMPSSTILTPTPSGPTSSQRSETGMNRACNWTHWEVWCEPVWAYMYFCTVQEDHNSRHVVLLIAKTCFFSRCGYVADV